MVVMMIPIFYLRTCVCPSGVREAEGPHADSRVQQGEGQSGWSPDLLLCSH